MDPLQERLTKVLADADWDSDEDETFFAIMDEARDEAISEFAVSRLQSFYLANPKVSEPAAWALLQAKLVTDICPSASLIFAVAAAEVCIKESILRPMVYGLVHQDYAARMVADLAVSHSGWDRFSALLAKILREKVGVDLSTAVITGTSRLLWGEFNELVIVRNHVVHRGKPAAAGQARAGMEIAETLLDVFFPRLLSNLGLSLNHEGIIKLRSPSG